MNIILVFLIISFIIIFLFIFLNKTSQKIVEKFERGVKEQITDQISDAYLPYSSNINIEINGDNMINHYIIISSYKKYLQRQPTSLELNKLLYLFSINEITEEKLNENLLNSPEYNMIVKVQSNDIEPGLEQALAKENIYKNISQIYYDIRKKDAPTKILSPLRDIYIHLQYNIYLFKSVLVHSNYQLFEDETINASSLTREKLLTIFNKYFLLSDLKLKANDIRKNELLGMKNINGEIPKPIEKLTNAEDVVEKKLKEDIEKEKEKEKENLTISTKNEGEKITHNDIIYDPINYKQSYRGDPLFRPPICTSLNQKQLVQPVFTDSKLLFQGTDINADTQIGSIMPKFKYIEYQDINVS